MQLPKKLSMTLLIAVVLAIAFLKLEMSAQKDAPPENSLSRPSKKIVRQNFNFSSDNHFDSALNSQNDLSKVLVENVQTRLQQLRDDDDPQLREQRIAELEKLLCGTNGLSLLAQLPPELMNFALGLPSFQKWIADDPKAAADWMSAREIISNARVSDLVHNWSQKNSAELQQYLASLPDGDWKQKTFAAVGNEILSSDPVAAIDFARQMNSSPQQVGILQQATASWAKSDFSAAANWANQIGDPQMREQLLAIAAVSLAENDPLQGAQMLVQSSSETILTQSASQITSIWAMQNPLAAAEWVSAFPADSASPAVANLVSVWGNSDRAGLQKWIAALPESPLRTEAISFSRALPSQNAVP